MPSKTPSRKGLPERRDHYAELTDRVIAALEAGTPPWQRPWDPDKAAGSILPQNAVTGARYRGINVLTLGMSPQAFSSGDPRWATYKQAAERGWQVRKGERSTTAFFFKRLEVADTAAGKGEDATKRIPLLRAFSLFNGSQIDGIPAYQAPTVEDAPWRTPESVDLIMARSGAVVRIGGERAFYSIGTDHIQMPPQHAFSTASRWSETLLHEGCHWTSGPTRLDRDLKGRFGSHDYAREELRAEIGMAMICGELGIDYDFPNTAAYLADWLGKLRSDPREIFRAAADAQRIADFMLAFHPDYAAASAGMSANSSTTIDTDSDEDQHAAELARAA